MTEYKIGDRVEILRDYETGYAPNGGYKKGEIHTVNFVDEEGCPTFYGQETECRWGNLSNWFRKIEETKPCDCDDEEDTEPTHDPVHKPQHYTAHPSGIECIQITEHMGFNLGNAMKYIWRADLKDNAIEDLQKAAWYVNREIEKRMKDNITHPTNQN